MIDRAQAVLRPGGAAPAGPPGTGSWSFEEHGVAAEPAASGWSFEELCELAYGPGEYR
jgi:hypothetical protein